MDLLSNPTCFLFFTGKGGVGKTSVSAAVAIALADSGRRVLLVSTDAASNLDEMLGVALANQPVPVPGVPGLSVLNIDPDDPVAHALEALGREALAQMPAVLASLPRDEVPLRAFDTVGLPALRALLGRGPMPVIEADAAPAPLAAEPLERLVEAIAAMGHGLIMVMGKGGVGKTTIAAAVAVGLVQRGHSVHLTTTDPAAHVAATLSGSLEGLKVGRIDPEVETRAYIDKIMATRGKHLDEAGRALLLEDLRSPCTEEVAVFHAFSRVVNEARSAFVVLDTAPTGHSLLLMDATGAYHRQMLRQAGGLAKVGHVITPLMRLQDPSLTRVILVTLPEVTPVSQAAALQDDLRRASIEPWAWVLNKSIAATGTHDPLLQARLAGEHRQTARIAGGLARRIFVVPWLPEPPVGVPALASLTAG